jgi:D-alanine-D-alanine ligase
LITPKEIEVAIVGNSELTVSKPGELILTKDFYDYEDKYKNNEATVRIPANISSTQQKKIQNLAVKIYKLCDCSGFARIDFFVAGKKIYLNEINTLPGFTDISMFPMLMTHHGMSYTQLVNNIIALAY